MTVPLPASTPLKICLLGAESSGKTTLCEQMSEALRARGWAVDVVWEFLREWCELEQRTPRIDEQLSIAQEQARRVDAMAVRGDLQVVISDTSPLMVAIYSDMLFDDTSLYAMALAHQRGFDLTLVMGLDIPWVADGLQRDGPHVRAPIDARLREALAGGGVAFQTVYGEGPARLAHAMRAVDARLDPGRNTTPQAGARWVWVCEKCSDPECEHRLFTERLKG